MTAIGASQVPLFARLLRASLLQQRGADYVLSAQTLGLSRRAITMSHVLPNSVGPVIVQGTLTLATAVIDAAALSFLGLGSGLPQTRSEEHTCELPSLMRLWYAVLHLSKKDHSWVTPA